MMERARGPARKARKGHSMGDNERERDVRIYKRRVQSEQARRKRESSTKEVRWAYEATSVERVMSQEERSKQMGMAGGELKGRVPVKGRRKRWRQVRF